MLRPRARQTQPRRRTEQRSPCPKLGSAPELMRFSTQRSEVGLSRRQVGGPPLRGNGGGMRRFPPPPGSLLQGSDGGCRLSPDAEMRPFPRDSAAQLFLTKTESPISPAVLGTHFQPRLQMGVFLKELFCRSPLAGAQRPGSSPVAGVPQSPLPGRQREALRGELAPRPARPLPSRSCPALRACPPAEARGLCSQGGCAWGSARRSPCPGPRGQEGQDASPAGTGVGVGGV